MSMARQLAFTAGIIAIGSAVTVHGSDTTGRKTDSVVAVCASCHGASGEGIEARSAPRLAGLHPAYLTRQLAAYADHQRGAHPADPFGSQMVVIAQSLTAADIADISLRYSRMKAPSPFATFKADPAKGKQVFETCATCHGPDGMGLPANEAPRIAGQADWYIRHSLQQYRSGARGGNAADANGQVMAAAAALINDKEIRDVSSYASGLGRR